MKRTFQTIFVATIIAAVVLTLLSIPALASDSTVNSVVKMIGACPAWSDLRASDILSRKASLACLERISHNDPDVIRKSMERYISNKRRRNAYDVSSMSRLYVLNRYVFNVPEKAKFDRPTFGGWMGVPHNSEEINLLWPLSYDQEGKLALTGQFGGYLGDDYLAIQELDYFRSIYGARRNKGKQLSLLQPMPNKALQLTAR